MPVEIRELVIKTEIHSAPKEQQGSLGQQELKAIRQQVMMECQRLLKSQLKNNSYNR